MSDLAWVQALGDDLDEKDLPWFIEPTDDIPSPEIERQASFIKQMATLAPSVDIVAIPNAGKSSEWERIQRHKEGARAGALDLVVTWEPTCQGDRGVAFPEFKSGKGKPTPAQRRRLNFYFRTGHLTGVYRRPETLIEHLRERGCPIRAVRS